MKLQINKTTTKNMVTLKFICDYNIYTSKGSVNSRLVSLTGKWLNSILNSFHPSKALLNSSFIEEGYGL